MHTRVMKKARENLPAMFYNLLVLNTNTDSNTYDFTMRVFQMNSSSGKFESTEVLNPARSSAVCPFPVLQQHLYSSMQPGELERKLLVYLISKPTSREAQQSLKGVNKAFIYVNILCALFCFMR